MYKLILHNQSNLFSSSDRRASIFPIRFDKDVTVCVRQEEKLIGYKYVGSSGGWKHQWIEPVFSKSDYSVDKYPWLVTDSLLPNKNVIVLRHPDGIRFYQVDHKGLKLLKEDGNFHEAYEFETFLLGKFYPNSDWVGVMTRDSDGEVEVLQRPATVSILNNLIPYFLLQLNCLSTTIVKPLALIFLSLN
jgi:hypothetical protein